MIAFDATRAMEWRFRQTYRRSRFLTWQWEEIPCFALPGTSFMAKMKSRQRFAYSQSSFGREPSGLAARLFTPYLIHRFIQRPDAIQERVYLCFEGWLLQIAVQAGLASSDGAPEKFSKSSINSAAIIGFAM
jgi:hypothetical protein